MKGEYDPATDILRIDLGKRIGKRDQIELPDVIIHLRDRQAAGIDILGASNDLEAKLDRAAEVSGVQRGSFEDLGELIERPELIIFVETPLWGEDKDAPRL